MGHQGTFDYSACTAVFRGGGDLQKTQGHRFYRGWQPIATFEDFTKRQRMCRTEKMPLASLQGLLASKTENIQRRPHLLYTLSQIRVFISHRCTLKVLPLTLGGLILQVLPATQSQ